jgi:alpha-L-fucosidase
MKQNRLKNRQWCYEIRIHFLCVIIIGGMLMTISGCSDSHDKTIVTNQIEEELPLQERLEWFQDAKYGMFIHWGLYAVPAGEWKGEKIPWIGEWIMRQAKIPVAEYEQLANEFNPVKFNAKMWVRLAKEAGMKYIVITAKHHDGFAMYHSKADPYNIVDATPFDRDPMKELADECAKQGVKLCFYYSHCIDWHEKDAIGNYWDFPENEDDIDKAWKKVKMEGKPEFDRYSQAKAIPQMRELLTDYGPIGLIWYDMPVRMSKEQCQPFVDVIRELQPNCLINGRIGHGLGDYQSMGDNAIPKENVTNFWETPMTLNDTWGYKTDDENWKSVETIQHMLVEIASKGGNFLLNVGPTAEGVVPQPSIDRIKEVGVWLKDNGESIYDTDMSPFKEKHSWGLCTAREGKLYLHVFDRPKDGVLKVQGLTNKVTKAYVLTSKKKCKFEQTDEQISVILPDTQTDSLDTVVVLKIQGKPEASSQN